MTLTHTDTETRIRSTEAIPAVGPIVPPHSHGHGSAGLAGPSSSAESLSKRPPLSAEERAHFEGALAELLGRLGLDMAKPDTQATPRRMLSALVDATSGYDGDPKLITAFGAECHGGASCEVAQIVEGPIPFYALCEHHAFPFFGRAWLGYVAHDQILGISKLTRLVRVLTRRFGVQEGLTHQIADELAAITGAHGVAVYLEAEHLCMRMRGVRDDTSVTRTTAYRGVYGVDPALRAEFRSIGGIGR